MALYKVKIRHEGDKGSSVVDPYIVDATSVIDAEAKAAASGLFTDYTVESITKPRISSVIAGVGDRYYRCKTAISTGSDKMVPIFYLVQADTFDDAVDKVKESMGNNYYEIEFVQLTPINGYIP